MNHTSDQHPWFKSARRSVDDPYRDYYVWSPHEAAVEQEGGRLPRQGGQHLGARREDRRVTTSTTSTRPSPTSTSRTPLCRRRSPRTLGFWLAARRLRLPHRRRAVPLRQRHLPGVRARRLQPRSATSRTSATSSPAGSATPCCSARSTSPTRSRRSSSAAPTATGSTCSSTSSGCSALYLSLARGDAGPLAAALRERPALDVTSQWANFVRNHDELTLDKLSTPERKEVFAAFGPDPDMQLYGRGLRRRLPTMLGGDERRIRLVYSLMFSLPGTPTLFYGEEIGMGENLDVEGRLVGAHADAVGRRPQRRLLDRAEAPAHPPAADGLFGPEHVNAARPAPGPRLALVLHPPAHPPLPADAADRLVRRRGARPRRARGARPRLPRATSGACSRCTTSGPTTPS